MFTSVSSKMYIQTQKKENVYKRMNKVVEDF